MTQVFATRINFFTMENVFVTFLHSFGEFIFTFYRRKIGGDVRTCQILQWNQDEDDDTVRSDGDFRTEGWTVVVEGNPRWK